MPLKFLSELTYCRTIYTTVITSSALHIYLRYIKKLSLTSSSAQNATERIVTGSTNIIY